MIDDKHRAILHVHAAVIDVERGLLRAELIFEEAIQLLGAAHLHALRDHDGPGENGEDEQEDDDDLRLHGGLVPHIAQLGFARRLGGGGKEKHHVHSFGVSGFAFRVSDGSARRAETNSKLETPNSKRKSITTQFTCSGNHLPGREEPNVRQAFWLAPANTAEGPGDFKKFLRKFSTGYSRQAGRKFPKDTAPECAGNRAVP